jgi:DNA-binding PadR family transcriptional regulator
MGKENKTIYVILGFLSHEGLTGYEIKIRIDLSLIYFGQIYIQWQLLWL